MLKPDADTLSRARRLISHHPAALRSVCWASAAFDSTLHHLEIETKHGQVVVFNHKTPVVYSQPPAPPETQQPRHWRDLTAEVPVAFDGRPLIIRIEYVVSPASWLLCFSTGAELSFFLDESTPSLAISHQNKGSGR